MLHFLDKERTIAKPGFNRWLVPPAALAIHLSIGMAYGFSVFWAPLSKLIGITKPKPYPEGMSFFQQLFSTQYDWKETMICWTFTLFFVFCGSAAAIFGGWIEKNGPRKAGVVAALCWGGGFLISAIGIYYHQIILLWLGSGVIGGCGLGLGYISPVSTLIKWFPDKRGMATGMAIMGFGGGALIGSPLAVKLMQYYSTPTSVGVFETFITMGIIYFIAMMYGAFSYRIPPQGWKPQGWKEPETDTSTTFITKGNVHVNKAHKTPQFWLLWTLLCLNVSAGIGIISVASPMLQRIFGGNLIGVNLSFDALSISQKEQLAVIGGAFTGLLSLFNIGGRIFWASLSDRIGRKTTYYMFFILGMFAYISAAYFAGTKNITMFVIIVCVILTMYGGGFATIPAYLADLFGTQYVGAIQGRLLTAWSAASILGPVLVNYIYEFQVKSGVPTASAYNIVLYIFAGFMMLGFISNLLVRPVDKRFFMSEEELEEERSAAKPKKDEVKTRHQEAKHFIPNNLSWAVVAVNWIIVGIPLAWGIYMTVEKAKGFF